MSYEVPCPTCSPDSKVREEIYGCTNTENFGERKESRRHVKRELHGTSDYWHGKCRSFSPQSCELRRLGASDVLSCKLPPSRTGPCFSVPISSGDWSGGNRLLAAFVGAWRNHRIIRDPKIRNEEAPLERARGNTCSGAVDGIGSSHFPRCEESERGASAPRSAQQMNARQVARLSPRGA